MMVRYTLTTVSNDMRGIMARLLMPMMQVPLFILAMRLRDGPQTRLLETREEGGKAGSDVQDEV